MLYKIKENQQDPCFKKKLWSPLEINTTLLVKLEHYTNSKRVHLKNSLSK